MNTQPTEKIVFGLLRRFVKKRYDDVQAHPQKLTIDRWNLSNFFYMVRKELDRQGYDTAPLNDATTGWRKRIYAKVRIICEKELGIKRHDAGIFPADRAVMAFQGQLHNVSYDNVEYLKRYGPDIIMIEKEGIVEKLVPFTTDLGIALIHSQGFYSEYADMLANEAIVWGANIGVLTDFDSAGINIALKIKGPAKKEKVKVKINNTVIEVDDALYKNTPKRLGIDFETMHYLGLSITQLQESSLNKKGEPTSHWVGLYNTLQGKKKRDNDDEWTNEQRNFYFPYLLEKRKELGEGDGGNEGVTYLDFLKEKRIELDTVVNAVGAQGFWAWLKQKVLDTFRTRDYNRAIAIPRYLPTPTLEKFQEKLEGTIDVITKDRREEIAKELRKINEFINTSDKLEQIKTDLLYNHILESPKIKKIDSTLKTLIADL